MPESPPRPAAPPQKATSESPAPTEDSAPQESLPPIGEDWAAQQQPSTVSETEPPQAAPPEPLAPPGRGARIGEKGPLDPDRSQTPGAKKPLPKAVSPPPAAPESPPARTTDASSQPGRDPWTGETAKPLPPIGKAAAPPLRPPTQKDGPPLKDGPSQRRETLLLGLILLAALVHGLLYATRVPAWQHYDEPTHFEHAWLIADRGALPETDGFDLDMRVRAGPFDDRQRFLPRAAQSQSQ